ncbi:MAG: polysaccharide deacetylase family protein [Oscillospiraceae bacterium]|nr:polysaccharide deacetylase family protein [Oscillospiraceae bacterium]
MRKKKRNIAPIAISFTALICLLAMARLQSPAAVQTSAVETVPTATASPSPTPTATPYAPEAPELRVRGEDPLILTAAPEPYADPGCEAWDSLDGDLSDRVEVSVEVDPYRAGEGSVSYTVTDSEGLSASAVRRVIVEAATVPVVEEPAQPVVYLTFDDGPSVNTPRLLDILDQYGVQATWFVTLTHPESTELIAEIANRGHTVAIHSASHDYQRIYASEEAFFTDLLEVQDTIHQLTGTRPTMLRFPGGSSNTVSRFNPGIMTRLAQCLNDMGYVYFDWNVSSSDTVAKNTAAVRDKIIGGISGNSASVVLQHDTIGLSVEAVPAIIEWGLNNGYIFLPLDEHSPTAHHGIAN